MAPPTTLFDYTPLRDLGARLLVIRAGADPLCDPEALASIVEPLGAESVVVEGADHFFTTGLPQVGRHAARFVG